jgi:methionyl-tRNA formyltransferase
MPIGAKRRWRSCASAHSALRYPSVTDPADLLARLAFLGTPEVAAGTLTALVDAGHEIVIVVSNPDRRRGRRSVPTPSPVKQRAIELGLTVAEQPAAVIGSGAELGIVVAYGQLIKAPVLDAVPMVNLHFSLLPRWRGAAPVERAILAGDAETGVCIMALELGLDTGPVYARAATPIAPDETADELRNRLGEIANRLLIERLSSGPAGLGEPEAQVGESTYAAKLTVEDRSIDFTRSAVECNRVVRVGRAFTTFRSRRLLIHQAVVVTTASSTLEPGQLDGDLVGTASGSLRLVEVQAEGRAAMDFATFAAGARPTPTERLGE